MLWYLAPTAKSATGKAGTRIADSCCN